MEGTLVTKPELKVAALGWTGPFEAASAIPEMWERFLTLADQIPNRRGRDAFVCPFHARPTDCTYYVGVEVSSFDHLPPGVVALRVPPRRYAAFTHTGPMSTVQDSFQGAFDWIAQRKLTRDAGALSIEMYDARFVPTRVDAEAATNAYDFFLPLK